MNNIKWLYTFCKVAELGSFSKAAEYLHQPKSRVSRSISKLEESLKTQLIIRTTRRFSLTESGTHLYERINPILNNLNNEIVRIESNSELVSGTLNISAPEDIGQFLLPEIVYGYRAIYPNVGINLHLSNDYIDFSKKNIDLAFRIGNLKDSSLVQTKLAKIKLVFVGSTKYFEKNGIPKDKDDLLNHKMIFFSSNGKIETFNTIKKVPSNAFSCSSFPLIYKLICQDYGIGIVPEIFCKENESKGIVQRVLTTITTPPSNLQIVYPQNKNLAKKVRTFLDYTKEKIKTDIMV